MLKRVVFAVVVLFIGLMTLAYSAKAEDIYVVETRKGEHVLAVIGGFTFGTADRVEEQLNNNPEIMVVALVSPGGVAMEGYALAQVFSEKGITAFVPKKGYCMSACAIAFLGAKEYQIDGVLGFHNAYIPEEAATNLTAIEMLITGQAFGAKFTEFVIANGFTFELATLVTQFTDPEHFIVFTSTEDLMRFFARGKGLSVNNYLEYTATEAWLKTHLWGPSEFASFFNDNGDRR